MHLSDFDYVLDPSLIAQHPLSIRDQSRLLFCRGSDATAEHLHFRALPQCLKSGDLLVFNNTRVIAARLRGIKSTGGKVELLLLRKEGPRLWEVLIGGTVRVGTRLFFSDAPDARVVELLDGARRRVEFSSDRDHWLERAGEVPLPPYIHRKAGPGHLDRERYQTIFAKIDGSVAAPTAGLHFTPSLLQELRDRSVGLAELTLHVGLGTFLPIRSEVLSDHQMHAEDYVIPSKTISDILKTKATGGRIIAVGTTTTRALESAFAGGRPLRSAAQTTLFIRPGYRFGVVDGLITNFHLPRSTLLILVAAFLGREKILSLYEEAMRERYRFYSFGDAMCIFR